MSKLISIIIPVYKVEHSISKCIESIKSQTYANWELILVDDESPDMSGDICEEFAKEDNRIVVFHIVNGGPSNARNYGLENATGSYVCFVDSDDWVEPTYLEHLYNGIQPEGIGIVVGGHFRDEDEKTTKRSVGDKLYDKSTFHDVFEGQRIVHWGFTVSKLYSLDAINSLNLRFKKNVRYCEDLIFFLEYWKHSDWIKFIPEIDYHYIIAETPNSLIVSYNSFESEFEGYINCKQCFETLAEMYSVSNTEIRHSYEWCAYMFTRVIKTMYRAGHNKLPYAKRRHNLKRVISHKDVDFAIQYTYYAGIDKLFLTLLRQKQFLLLDLVLSTFFALRYCKLLQPLVNRRIQSLKK